LARRRMIRASHGQEQSDFSRARKRGGAPTVRVALPSADAALGRKDGGMPGTRKLYLHLAAKLTARTQPRRHRKTTPEPPVALRPKAQRHLYRDAARDPTPFMPRILGLKELDPLGGPSVWGSRSAVQRRWSALSMIPADLRWMRAKTSRLSARRAWPAIGGRRFRRAHLAALNGQLISILASRQGAVVTSNDQNRGRRQARY